RDIAASSATMARTNSTIECATTAIERQVQRPTASAHRRSPSGNPRLSAFCRSAPTDVGHRLFRRRAGSGSGHARRQPGSPAPAGNAGGAVDVLEARPGRVRRVHRGPASGRGAALHAPLAARAGRGSLQALRHADDRQGRHPAVLTSGGPDTAFCWLLFRTRVTRHQGGQTSRARDALAGAAGHPDGGRIRVPGYEFSFWTGIGAPKNTPAAIVDKFNTEINAALADPKMKARLAELGRHRPSGLTRRLRY